MFQPYYVEVSIVLQISTHPNLGLNLMHSAVRLSQLFTANIFVKDKNKPKNTSRNLMEKGHLPSVMLNHSSIQLAIYYRQYTDQHTL